MKKAVRKAAKKVVKKKTTRKRVSAHQYREIDRRFDFVEDVGVEETQACIRVRKTTKQLARTIARETPICREQSLAVTKLEEALHFAIAAIVRSNENS